MHMVKKAWRGISELGDMARRRFGGPTLPADFNELAYLELNPDVRQAVIAGAIESGASHYVLWGGAGAAPLQRRQFE